MSGLLNNGASYFNFQIGRFRLPFLILICCHYATATVVLDSSVGQVCPGEMVTYTCTVNQGAVLDWIVEPFLPASTRIRFTSTTSTGRSFACNDPLTVNCVNFNFVATLTNIANPTVILTGTLADMTSTLAFTATARLNGTVVQCRGTTEAGSPVTNHTINITGLPSPPQTLSSTVQQYGQDSVTVTLQWQPPQYDGGAPVNYTITVSPGLSPVTTSGTSVPVTVPYNVIHTVSIVATNCNGSSSATMETIPAIVNCGPPVAPQRGSINYTSTTEGSEVFYSCDQGLVPEGRMRAVCTRNGWSPNPAGVSCSSSSTIPSFDCGPPFAPRKGSLESYTDTTVGTEVFYSCNQGLIPEGRMRAVCTRNGWSPNPAGLSCTIGCSSTDLTPTDRQCADRGFANTMPIPSGVVCYSRITVGSEALYICDDGFHQDGAATRVCQSDGVWNSSIPQCFLDQGEQEGAGKPLTTGTIVAIAVASTAVVAFVTGILAGITIYHCISTHRSHQSLKPETSSQQQPQPVLSSNPLQQTVPEYEEVVELRQNRAYELTQTGIEMRVNESYQPT